MWPESHRLLNAATPVSQRHARNPKKNPSRTEEKGTAWKKKQPREADLGVVSASPVGIWYPTATARDSAALPLRCARLRHPENQRKTRRTFARPF